MRKGVTKRQEPLTGKQDARNDEDERDRKSGFLLGKEGNASRGQIVSESKGWEKMASLEEKGTHRELLQVYDTVELVEIDSLASLKARLDCSMKGKRKRKVKRLSCCSLQSE